MGKVQNFGLLKVFVTNNKWDNWSAAWLVNTCPVRSVMKLLIHSYTAMAGNVWEWISNFIPHFIMDVITYLIFCHASWIVQTQRP